MTPGVDSLLLFISATLLLLVVPGPAVFYIVARSIDQGRTAGVVSMLGIAAGTYVHIFAAALGLSALLVSSATAFSVVKYAGAAYLIVIGVRRLMERDQATVMPVTARASLKSIFWQGAVVNILNPKTAVFFLAFLPQFADPSRGSLTQQILFLGTLFVVLGVVSDGAYALLAGAAGGWLRGHPRFLRLHRPGSRNGPFGERPEVTADEIIAALKLVPLDQEGGYYVETWRSEARAGNRNLASAIYYLLTPDTFSAIHRLRSDEVFHFYVGDPVEMVQLNSDGTGRTVRLGSNIGRDESPQVVVPRGVWQGSRLLDGGRVALMGTTVTPGFDFDDFELGDRLALITQYPDFRVEIEQLTRS